MSVQTVLIDFSIDAVRLADEIARKDLMKLVKAALDKFFTQLKFVCDVQTDDGCLSLFSDRNLTVIQVRIFNAGLVTINIEYYKREQDAPAFTFDVSMMLVFVVWRRRRRAFRGRYYNGHGVVGRVLCVRVYRARVV